MSAAERRARYAVAVCGGVGPVTMGRIADINGAEGRRWGAFMRLSDGVLTRDYGLSDKQIAAVRRAARDAGPWGDDVACAEAAGWRLVFNGEPAYPATLNVALERRAPSFLFILGNGDLLAGPAVAVIGTRRPTPHGAQAAGAVARALVRQGKIIVSGFAEGVDQAAHQAALDAGGATTLVLSRGARWAGLPDGMLRAAAAGRLCAISQFHPTQRLAAGTAMARNLIVAALAQKAVAVETDRQGGTMETARMACALGRPVLAVWWKDRPDLTCEGARALIDDGAWPLEARWAQQGEQEAGGRGEKGMGEMEALVWVDQAALVRKRYPAAPRQGQQELPIDTPAP